MIKPRRWACVGIMALSVLLVTGCLLRPANPNQITYRLPTQITVAVGHEIPGTTIRFESMGEQGAYLRIQGQQALKRKGDSVNWKGNPLPGVAVELKLRVAWYTAEELYLVGTAKVVVDEIHPQMAKIETLSPIKYSGPVIYNVNKGATIPGATWTYEGRTEEGAKLGGIEGYPYRAVGDSIFWEGKLRERVYIRLDLRALQFDDKGLRVGGIVTVWLGP
jgi:hypothetical protein